ncbi:hypothetical protein BC834DRAFT_844660 [Gloeopeniophorella convolvens]|nr:hypothetical protein BC834DRAFT_844660 [Gloeopeniophorella convolvens]
MAGSILAAILYWLGLYEAIEPPRWIWFLHTDYAPAIGYSCKCFLGGGKASSITYSGCAVDVCAVMQALALYWEMLPFCLFIGIPVLVLMRVPSHPVLLFPGHLNYFAVVKWRIWKRMWVWHPIRRFFHSYGVNYPTPGRYRLFGKAGFILGLLSGVVLLGPGAFLLQLHFLTQKGRAAQDTPP